MFKKIIIAEDHDTNHSGIVKAFKHSNPIIETVKYCDDALPKLKASVQMNEPFEVLITDLQFNEDGYRDRELTSGEDLIVAAREIIPDIKIIVFSVEKGVARILNLRENLQIDAFVEKVRHATEHIKRALNAVSNDSFYCTPVMKQLLGSAKEIIELEKKDIEILKLLSLGNKQREIAAHLNCSKSTVEKQLNKLKLFFDANNPVHMISIAKDWGII